jgi:putative transposase
MIRPSKQYRRHRFPPQIISHAVWLYHRFSPSFRDVEDLLAQRGVEVSYETVRRWCLKFGPGYASRTKRRQRRLGDTWHLDEVFIRIGGRQQYLWRAVDQDGDVIDILVQSRRDQRAAKRFLRKLVSGQGGEPNRLVTDKLRSYGPAHREVMPSVPHDTRQYANNRAEVSHQPTRQRERQMRRFKSWSQAQRVPTLHGLVQNLFRFGRHLMRSVNARVFRERAFSTWQEVTCVL